MTKRNRIARGLFSTDAVRREGPEVTCPDCNATRGNKGKVRRDWRVALLVPSADPVGEPMLFKSHSLVDPGNEVEGVTKMAFWNLSSIESAEFRPGILSKAEIGSDLIMACMEIGPGKEDTGHEHPFDQGGVILKGQIEMFVGEERKTLRSNEAYFIPAGMRHGWKTFEQTAKILDISAKQK